MEEQLERLKSLKDKISALNIIIREGELYDEFKKSGFFDIFKQTFISQKESYSRDAYKASKDSRAEISAFLSRMEQIDDMFDILEQFSLKAIQAQDEKYICEEEMKEINDSINQPHETLQDVGGAMG